jgi:DNA-binding XRE family transcriptional regulator
MPKPEHEPTPETRSEVQALASFGVNREDIASYIGIAKKTLLKHYKEELDTSAIKAHATVGKFLYKMASGQAIKEGASYAECSRAAMFWAKTQMGWKETVRNENVEVPTIQLNEIEAGDDNE